ncbi:hypothetical protein B0H13DRAFT_2659552 [Mycena leptocephala]|nr:hypothetical protein B0H13DRAFT_2659552 [Mycena leptocephala]
MSPPEPLFPTRINGSFASPYSPLRLHNRWAAAAHLPYFPARSRPLPSHRALQLLHNRRTCSGVRVQSARRNVRLRPYGFPADLAADADVEVMVCCTRIDVHYATVRPARRAQKIPFCEWPLAHKIDAVRETHVVRTMAGVQGPVAPAMRKLKEGERIGRAVGGGRCLPSVLGTYQIQFVRGDATTIQSCLHLRFPHAKLCDSASGSNLIVKTVPYDVPDLIIASCVLPASPPCPSAATSPRSSSRAAGVGRHRGDG